MAESINSRIESAKAEVSQTEVKASKIDDPFLYGAAGPMLSSPSLWKEWSTWM
jgi:hypothetical protein